MFFGDLKAKSAAERWRFFTDSYQFYGDYFAIIDLEEKIFSNKRKIKFESENL